MTRWIDHILILPIIVPLLAGAGLLLIEERNRNLKAAVSVASVVIITLTSAALLYFADSPSTGPDSQHVLTYRVGNWPAEFGIVLVGDRLSATMLALASVLALAAVLFSLARWQYAGSHFHSLFQFLLMGLNGAFLTGDLFNLFVFFEVLLAASYGLVLHGSGILRVRAGLHYIVVNLATSLLFLIGVSLIYSTTGTLNMAELATRIPQVPAEDRMLMQAGAAVLGIAFLVKSGIWPLSFWLPTAYAAATPPVAAMFSIMSKVGIYVILRLWLLFFGADSGASAGFGGEWLLIGGIATVAFGIIGVLAAQDMSRLAGYAVLISSGTVLSVIAAGDATATGAALFYLVSSTLAIAAFFMLIELVERGRDPGADMLAVTREAYGDDEDDEDAPKVDEVGVVIPATMALLGICFLGCALVLSGLPPLSGFIAKFAVLTALFNVEGVGSAVDTPAAVAWVLVAALLTSGLMTLIAITRAGIRTLWSPQERVVPRVRVLEFSPIVFLLIGCLAMTVLAGPTARYMQAAAEAVHAPRDYIRSVLAPVPEPQMPDIKGGS